MRIPFTKAHGAKNDFLLTWKYDAPADRLPEIAQAICDRHTGIGADGWMLIHRPARADAGCDGAIRLFNADGSEPELSGNGTRCAAAFLVDSGLDATEIAICTGAGLKNLKLLERSDCRFLFEMDMGEVKYSPDQIRHTLPLSGGPREVTLVNPGNPQCAVFVEEFDFDWRAMGAEIERHRFFPNRTNVSFIKVVDEHTIDVRFFERGVGETMSSGTGATGAAAAAVLRGACKSPIAVMTPAGRLDLRWDERMYLTGPAEIVGGGEFYL